MCKVKARIGRTQLVMQTIGYRGKREARTHLGDLHQARALIVYKKDAQKLKGLKVGKTVTVKIGRRKIKAVVKKWSRGSRLLLPTNPNAFKGLPPSVIAETSTRRRRRSSKRRKRRR